MDIFLQAWGGIFYLLQKIFLCYAEGTKEEARWRVRGWACVLIALPAWTAIFINQRLWIVLADELGGAPSMVLGLTTALRGSKPKSRLLDTIAGVFMYSMIVLGILYSWYRFGGIVSVSQILELCVTTAFLIGTYLLAKQRPAGWIMFSIMNACMGTLLATQGEWFLVAQQAASLVVDVYGYIRARRRTNN